MNYGLFKCIHIFFWEAFNGTQLRHLMKMILDDTHSDWLFSCFMHISTGIGIGISIYFYSYIHVLDWIIICANKNSTQWRKQCQKEIISQRKYISLFVAISLWSRLWNTIIIATDSIQMRVSVCMLCCAFNHKTWPAECISLTRDRIVWLRI